MLAEGAEEAGVIEHEERRMMVEVLRLADRSVESIMTPRRDIYWIDLGDGEAKVRDEIRESPFSRILVGQNGSIDEPLGVVLKKTLLDALLAGKPFDVRAALTQPIYVPRSATALNLPQLFKSQTSHLAVVVDEYGSIQGVVTPHDLLSAIAGELQEEHSPSTPSVIARGTAPIWWTGVCDLIELEDALGLKTEDRRASTPPVSPFRPSRLPRDGEVTQWEGWRIEVVDMDGPRIDKLLFKEDLSGVSRRSGPRHKASPDRSRAPPRGDEIGPQFLGNRRRAGQNPQILAVRLADDRPGIVVGSATIQ